MSRVLFVCVHNAGRSQMSQAVFNRAAGDGHEARSAGGDACPYIPGKRSLDRDLKDPKGQSLDAVRATRDEIDRRITGLLAELDA